MQYWTGQPLSTVPEGMPILNAAPQRRASNAWEGGDRLSQDFSRLSFDKWVVPVGCCCCCSCGGGGLVRGLLLLLLLMGWWQVMWWSNRARQVAPVP